MDIEFGCYKCGQSIVIDKAGAGMIVPCPTCGERLAVPIETPYGIVKRPVMNSKNWISNCSQNDYEQIQRSLVEGLDKGETMRELTKRVQKEFNGVDKDRAFIIAQTETSAASGRASFESVKGTTFTTKRWVTSDDDEVRPSHAACQAQGAIPIDEPFSNGLMYPGDLSAGKPDECIGCRCFLAAGDPDE
jgi:SPP1 gp7 family putative phage head morphogenesis protein